jgi:3-hydroxyisobutyrate dehydrogenase-like beta-hydroxyacid dehydrogenase
LNHPLDIPPRVPPTSRSGITLDVGLIGVGKMGLPIARHFSRAGHRVSAYDASPARMLDASQAELATQESVEALVGATDIIFSSLPNDAAFEAVARQVSQYARPGQLHVDTSTVSLAASRRTARMLSIAGVSYLRVAVSGNPQMIENAQLTSIASGAKTDYERVLPLLRLLGPSQFYVGPNDESRVMKLVINLMVASTAATLAEALALGQKGGLEWQAMWDVICGSAVASPIVRSKAVQLQDYDFTPTFTVDQMLKDVRLMLEAGESLHVPLRLTALVAQALQHAVALGAADDDYAALIKAAQHSAGLTLDARKVQP